MQSGEPYDTTETHATRERQRRLFHGSLPRIPQVDPLPDEIGRVDAAAAESILREYADSLVGEHEGLAELLEESAKSTAADRARLALYSQDRMIDPALAAIEGRYLPPDRPPYNAPDHLVRPLRTWQRTVALADALAERTGF